jgi:hypothetical protein
MEDCSHLRKAGGKDDGEALLQHSATEAQECLASMKEISELIANVGPNQLANLLIYYII